VTPRKKNPRKHDEVLSKKDREVLVLFGTQVRTARQKLALTQGELLERVPLKSTGHAQAWLSRVESGQFNVSLIDIVKLARALETPVYALVVG